MRDVGDGREPVLRGVPLHGVHERELLVGGELSGAQPVDERARLLQECEEPDAIARHPPEHVDLLASPRLLRARLELRGHVGHDEERAACAPFFDDRLHGEREVAAVTVEALRHLLRAHVDGEQPVGDLLPAERQEKAEALVGGRQRVGEVTGLVRRAEPAIERGRTLGAESAPFANRREPLVDVVEHEAHRGVAGGELARARVDERLEGACGAARARRRATGCRRACR